MVGLGLDGASAISEKFKGVQACIREKYPMVHYTYCSLHSLNMAIGKANTVAHRRSVSMARWGMCPTTFSATNKYFNVSSFGMLRCVSRV